MSATAPPQHAPLDVAPARGLPFLQRACACGGSAGISGKCVGCDSNEKLGVPPLQAKLTVSAPDDPYEKEADEVAERVMRMPAGGAGPLPVSPVIQREAAGPEDEEEVVSAKLAGPLQRDPMGPEDEDEPVAQRKAAGRAGPAAPAGFAAALGAPSSGALLPAAARSFFEPRFQRDLGHVKIHDGASAAAMARDINARAFTAGADIYFAPGQYDPASSAGRRLLAHELTHVFQQGGERTLRRKGADAATVRLPMDSPANANEAAADHVAEATRSMHPIDPPPPGGAASSDGSAELPAALAAQIVRPAGGERVADAVRRPVEARLGVGFGHVRVHRGPAAEDLAGALEARAFTYGADIWVGRGESASDPRLMAHELAHVAQQAPRPLSGGAPPRRLQAVRYYYSLPRLYKEKVPGTRVHDSVQDILARDSHNSGLYTEAPIPEGGVPHGTRITDPDGRADLLKTDTGKYFGVKFDGKRPTLLNMSSLSRLNGHKITDATHRNSATPIANRQGKTCRLREERLPENQGICRVNGPAHVFIADIKPNYLAEIMLSQDQVTRYGDKVVELGTKVDEFARDNPELAKPAGARWNVKAHPLTDVTIPPEYMNPGPGSRLVPVELYGDEKGTGIDDHAYLRIAHHKTAGFMTYDFIRPQDLGQGYSGSPPAAPGPIDAALDARKQVQESLQKQPDRIARLPRPGPRIARKSDRLEARETFNLDTWKTQTFLPWKKQAVAATGREKSDNRVAKGATDARRRMVDEATRQIAARNPGITKQAPQGTAERTRKLDQVQHWIDDGEKYGRLRQIFGTAFVKLFNAYEKVKTRIGIKVGAIRARFRSSARGISDPKKAAIAGLVQIAGSLLTLFIKDIGRRLAGAVQTGSKTFLAGLFGEEKARIEEQIQHITDLGRRLEAFLRETVETWFGAQIDQLEKIANTIAKAAQYVRRIGWLADMVKWAIRLAQCGLPPLLGCLAGLLTSKLAELIIAGIIAGCWFRRDIAYPLVEKIDGLLGIPAEIAMLIAKKTRSLLPVSLRPIIGDPAPGPGTASRNAVECSNNKKYNFDPSQTKLSEMFAAHDEKDAEHVQTLLAALKHLGVATDDPNPKAKVTDAEIAHLKKLLDTYSKDKLQAIIDGSDPRVPSTKTAGEFLADLDMAAKQPPGQPGGQPGDQAGGQPGGAPGGAAGGAQDGAGTISDEKKKEEGAEAMRRMETFKPKVPRNDVRLSLEGVEVGKTAFVFVHRDLGGRRLGGFTRITLNKDNGNGTVNVTLHAGSRVYAADGSFFAATIEDVTTNIRSLSGAPFKPGKTRKAGPK